MDEQPELPRGSLRSLRVEPALTADRLASRVLRGLSWAALTLAVSAAAGASWLWEHPAPRALAGQCGSDADSQLDQVVWPMGEVLGGSTTSGRDNPPRVPFDLTPAELSIVSTLAAGDESYAAHAKGAALASGLSSAEDIARFEELVEAVYQRLSPAITAEAAGDRAAQLLRALHQSVLRFPDDRQPSPARALETGVFNCVSATILFNVYACRIGLRTAAVAQPDHVYSLLLLDERAVSVSTTRSDGYDSGLPVYASTGFTSSLAADRGKISDAALFATAIEDRLAFRMDDLLREGTGDDPQAIAMELALRLRISRLDPANHDAAAAYAGLLRTLGGSLDRRGRDEQSFTVTNLALDVARRTTPHDVPDALNDLAVATAHDMSSQISGGRNWSAVQTLRRARSTANCFASPSDCEPIDSDASTLLGDSILSRIDRGNDNRQVWPLTEGLIEAAGADREDGTISRAVLYESSRLERDEGLACSDEFLARVHQRLLCSSEKRAACLALAGWAVARTLTTSPERAVWWLQQWVRQE